MRFREAFFHDRDPRWTNIRHARELANCVITADWPLRVDLGHLADDISSQANFGLWLLEHFPITHSHIRRRRSSFGTRRG
jgi:hypothetical protein